MSAAGSVEGIGGDHAASAARDARFMGEAIELARRGEGTTRPNPLVGSLIVRDGRVVGRGYHVRAGLDHAEVVALAQAGELARGATLYSNLEPCSHQGRTPPCVGRILRAGIARVVASIPDPNPLVNGGGFRALEAAGVAVVRGVLEEEALLLNEPFLRRITTGLPLVTIKAAASLDGRISAARGNARWISSSEAREEAMRLRARHDAVLVGAATAIADDPLLSVRAPAAVRPISRVILDPSLRVPPRSRLFRSPGDGPVLVYHTDRAASGDRDSLERLGATPILVGSGDRIDLEAMLRDLAAREHLSVLVEGGGRVIGSFVAARLASRFSVFLAPSLLGEGGTPLVRGFTADAPGSGIHLAWTSLRRIGPDLLLEASPRPITDGAGESPAGGKA
jgi:diaminohydroxyphosphoribosylaminopyrimidine deaminase/5-amino-6-(5-phosphoribosylamino)uracil reductase